ncbi:Branched-chain amino acid ABC-type transport system, permease components [Kluyvera cryocrescens]|uniref:Branched-chain amino acid ABC-type transport system, permease components n=1 Tax=Kluyvera cryocrescens TaxID=580 RepID=A0A485D2R7_KLUCR|nr:Branched-chain amino acid ABC-type transport system, permease components [Kluyvera cryocrescens]
MNIMTRKKRPVLFPAFAFLLLCSLFMSASALAGPAADYGKASRSEQAKLLQQWAADPQASRLPLLEALSGESVVSDEQGQLFSERGGKLLPLEGNAVPSGNSKKVFMNNRIRGLIASALAAHQLVSDDEKVRLERGVNAAKRRSAGSITDVDCASGR